MSQAPQKAYYGFILVDHNWAYWVG